MWGVLIPSRMLAGGAPFRFFAVHGIDIAKCLDESGRVKLDCFKDACDMLPRDDTGLMIFEDDAQQERTEKSAALGSYYARIGHRAVAAADNTHKLLRADADAEWMTLVGLAALKNDMEFYEVYEAFVKAWEWEYAPYFVGAAEVVYPSGAVHDAHHWD